MLVFDLRIVAKSPVWLGLSRAYHDSPGHPGFFPGLDHSSIVYADNVEKPRAGSFWWKDGQMKSLF